MKLNNIINSVIFCGTLCIIIFLYFSSIQKFQGALKEYYLNLIYFFSIFLIILFFNFFFKKKLQENIFILLASTIFSLYLLEISIYFYKSTFSKLSIIEKKFPNKFKNYDSRNRNDFYYSELLKKNKDSVVRISPDFYYIVNKDTNIFPLSGVSKRETLLCNESGKFITYYSDRYGFNNPDYLWDKKEIEYLLIGDSFVHGDCVEEEKNLSGNIRKISNKKSLNLGYNGNGPLIELATLKEYTSKIIFKKIFWFYYEGNDRFNLMHERNNKILSNYLRNPDFRQELRNKQTEIDKIALLQNQRTVKKKINSKKDFNLINFIKLKNLRNFIFFRSRINVDDDLFKIIYEANSFSKKMNSEFIFIFIPSYERIKFSKKFEADQKKLFNFLSKNKIKTINLYDDFFAHKKDPLSFFPFKLKGHFNEKGYQEISEYLIQKIHAN